MDASEFNRLFIGLVDRNMANYRLEATRVLLFQRADRGDMNRFLAHRSGHRRGFTLIELMIVVAIIGILLAIAAWNYPILLGNIKKKACIANMRTIYGASQLALMENPSVPNLTVKFLTDKGYLKKMPVCPSLGQDHNNGFYSIIDTVGKPLDVVCVITQGAEGHGSLRKLLNMDNTASGGGSAGNDGGGEGDE